MSNMTKGGYREDLKIDYYRRKGGKKIKLICLQCGKEYERYVHDTEGKYCSLKCFYKSRTIKMPPRNILYKKYWLEKLSTVQLGKEFSVNSETVSNWMKRMEIPKRSISKGVSIIQIGTKHSKEWNKAISRGQNNMRPELKKKRTLAILQCNRDYGNRSRSGTRKDLGIYLRSRWEANLGRYYNYIGIKWLYESKIFYFNESPLIKKKIKKGTLSYTPDFYLPKEDKFVEVKGWFRPEDKTKLKRFRKYYPEEFKKLRFMIWDKYSKSKSNAEMIKFLCDDLGIYFNKIESYKEIEDKLGALISNWE